MQGGLPPKARDIMKRGRVIFFYALALCVLLGVFTLYLRPDFLVTLANQVWACF